MGTRFIHKNGRAIPIHSDHGDQQQPGPQHAQPMNPPANPSPVAGHSDTPHPEPRPAPAAPAPVATVADAGADISKGFNGASGVSGLKTAVKNLGGKNC